MHKRFYGSVFTFFILIAVIFTALPVQTVQAATFTVTKTADTNDGACDADCSLREAVTAANGAPGADTITVPTGTYSLTLGGSGENGNSSGDLDVTEALTIVGAGESTTIIQQTTNDRVFHILSGNFSISAVTISDGNISGGDGGGVFHDSGNDLTIDHVTFSGNSAEGSFGGGAIRSGSGTTLISNSTFINNTASNSNGGGAILFGGGEFFRPVVTITNSTFSDNQVSGQFGHGGAINSNADPIIITGSTFTNNQANAEGPFSNSNGGAFDMDSSGASAIIANSTFTGNSAKDSGGGIFVRDDGALTLRNVTIASNIADSDANGAGDGGGLYVQDMGVDGTNPSVGNTIFGGNSDTGGEMPDCGGDGSDHFDSAGHNLIQNLTGCILGGTTAGNITGFNPLLGALANNGGPTQTRALLTGSPAIDAGDNALCAAAPVSNVDQRGITRPQDAACDIGAYEMVTPLLVTSRSLLATYTAPGPSSFTVTFNKPVSDLGENSDPDDVTNPSNYLVVERGPNGITNTVSCADGVAPDDVLVLVTSVTYNPATTTATVFFASPLPAGNYTVFVCGTTSIVDLSSTPLAGNGVNPGTDNVFNFVVNPVVVPPTATAIPIPGGGGTGTANEEVSLPKTGFAPGVVSLLPAQPAEKAYTDLGEIWIEIPSQNVKASIYGVPVGSNGWDTTWLGNNAGWLHGTAFPTWEGNSVITGHVTNSEGAPGPFANLKKLKYGDTIIVHMNGQRYVFEVRKSRLVRPQSTSYALEHLEDYSYLTLITCQGFNSTSSVYRFRRVVRAVLVRVEADK